MANPLDQWGHVGQVTYKDGQGFVWDDSKGTWRPSSQTEIEAYNRDPQKATTQLNQQRVSGAPAPLTTGLENQPDSATKNLSKENHLDWQRYLPKESDELAGGIAARNQTGQYLTDELSRGLDDNKQINTAAPGGSSLGSPMNQAIANKYNSQVQDKIGMIKQNIKANVPAQYSSQLGRAGDYMAKGQSIDMQNFKEQYDYQTKRAELKNQWDRAQGDATNVLLGVVVGAVGAVAGYFAGGPAGAAAGAGAGFSAGSKISDTDGGGSAPVKNGGEYY